ncbi:methyltransferase domain-containing protein [Agromyces sp. SYSU K20354]|uniref:methyltransferase domain-containing protein n=1 Tax=Agromyces cavernae TaxID=2898659 RepID=UPI001E486351|nr:methyltransferase domain-containing protein [Agromyces cavernae]MCD2441063.1 methyltransferase domain-containing protein [Agromyces cavernae]
MRHPFTALATRDERAIEQMDTPDADPHKLAKTYERFRLVNAIVSGERAVYRRWVRPRLSPVWGTRLLDVGTGSADLPRRMLRWAHADGLRLEITAIDPDERAIAWAEAQPPVRGLTARRAMTGDLVSAGERFQIVLSNHVLHHLDGRETGALLADCERLVGPGGIVVLGDIERSCWGYAGFWFGTLPFAGNLLAGTYCRGDGLASIRRSHTATELAGVLPPGWRVRRAFPSRLEVAWGSDA